MSLSTRGQVTPFYAMEVLKTANQLRAQGLDVISLCLGEPSAPAPAAVRTAAKAALENGALGYTDACGIPPLRRVIAEYYAAEYGVEIDPARVIITTGSSAAFTALILAAFETGDTVAITRPGYPAYRNVLATLGCQVVELDCDATTNFQPTVAMLEDLDQPPAGLIVASPSNPTGTILAADQLRRLTEWCESNGTLLISDEIYHRISFDTTTASVTEFSDRQVAVGSFSKYFCMTGWRIGWTVVPESMIRTVELLLGNLNLSTPALSQIAAVQAFSTEARAELDTHVAQYRANRDLAIGWCTEMGLDFCTPQGAFYLYPRVTGLTDDSSRWCAEVLAATGVAITPGVDFAPVNPALPSPVDGSGFVRISLAGAHRDLEQAFNRLADHLRP